MNDSMARPQARTPGPERWQKALDIVTLSWPGVCPGLGELLSQGLTAVDN